MNARLGVVEGKDAPEIVYLFAGSDKGQNEGEKLLSVYIQVVAGDFRSVFCQDIRMECQFAVQVKPANGFEAGYEECLGVAPAQKDKCVPEDVLVCDRRQGIIG